MSTKAQEKEKRFQQIIAAENFTDAEKYILRLDMELPAEKPANFPAEETDESQDLIRTIRMKVWEKVPVIRD